jgi:hypothetical protein
MAAGNASDADIYTMPASNEGFISNVTAYNNSAGPLDLTITLKRQDGLQWVQVVSLAIAAGATVSFSGGATNRITPLVMLAGEIIQAKGSGAGLEVTVSGLRNSI